MKWKWKNLQKVGKLVCKVVLYWDSFESGPPPLERSNLIVKIQLPLISNFLRERERDTQNGFFLQKREI